MIRHNSSVYKQALASILLEMGPTVCPTTTTTWFVLQLG